MGRAVSGASRPAILAIYETGSSDRQCLKDKEESNPGHPAEASGLCMHAHTCMSAYTTHTESVTELSVIQKEEPNNTNPETRTQMNSRRSKMAAAVGGRLGKAGVKY